MPNLSNFKKAIISLGNEKTLKALLKQPDGLKKIYTKYFDLYGKYDYSRDEGLRSFFGDKPRYTKKESLDAIARIDLLDTLVRDGVENFTKNLENLASNSNLSGEEITTLTTTTNPAPLQEIFIKQMTKIPATPAPAPSEEEKEEVNVPTPEEERKEMSRAEGESMQMEIDADASQTPVPAPKVSLRGVRVKTGKPKGKVTIKSVKRVEKPKVEASASTMKEAEEVLGKERLDAIIEEENMKLQSEDDLDKLQKETEVVLEKLVKDAKEKREQASQRARSSIEDIAPGSAPEPAPARAATPAPAPEPMESTSIPEPAPEKAPTPPSTPIKMRVNKVTEIKKDVLPTAIDLIPPEKLSSEDKTVQELKDDINYFYINFPEKLRRIKKPRSSNLKVLQRAHKRIVAVLRGDKVDRDAEKQVGVIIKGENYIKDVLKEIILSNSINGLSAEDLLVNIDGQPDTDKPTIGNYEFKTNPVTGKDFAEGQPVSRLIPTTEPKQVDSTKATYKKPVARIPMPRTQYRGPEVTAKKQVAANPFLDARQPKIRLKYSY